MKNDFDDLIPNENEYMMSISCNNCSKENMCKILKGVKIKEYVHKNICEYCGCQLDTKRGLIQDIKDLLSKIIKSMEN